MIAKKIALAVPRSKSLLLGFFISGLQAVSTVALLATSAWLIARAAEMPPVLFLQLAVVGVRGFALGKAVFRYLERLILHSEAFKQLTAVRTATFQALIPLVPAGLPRKSSGEILSTVINDVDEVQFVSLRVVAPVVQALAVVTLSTVGLSFLVPGAALSLLSFAAASIIVAFPITAALTRKNQNSLAADRSALTASSLKLFESVEEHLAFGWSAKQLEQIEFHEAKLAKTAKKASWSNGLGQAFFSLFSTATVILSALYGAAAVTNNSIVPMMLALITLLPLAVFDVLQVLLGVAPAWQRFNGSASRLLEVLEAGKPWFSYAEQQNGVSLTGEFRHLRLQDVTLGYSQDNSVLANFNLDLSAGESLLITGASGSGKSTIALTLAGFMKPSNGHYLFNDQHISQDTVASLHHRVCYLEQTPVIFNTDLAANLRIAKPEASDHELIEVLRRTKLWKTFETREGLATRLGETGESISGGEAARIAIARALLGDFDVLVFDEPTANLDLETGSTITNEIFSLANSDKTRAIVVISHDLELARLATRTIRL